MSVGLAVVASLGLGAHLLFRGTAPVVGGPAIFGGPDTCREVVELLQARGMQLRWSNRSTGGIFRHPSVYIFLPADKDPRPLEVMVFFAEFEYRPPDHLFAGIAQYPSAREAREAAGTMKHAFSWGRFLIYGDAELVDEIRKRL
jgi:hypothetical protein